MNIAATWFLLQSVRNVEEHIGSCILHDEPPKNVLKGSTAVVGDT